MLLFLIISSILVPTLATENSLNLKVLSLNVWGLQSHALLVKERIREIADYIQRSDYAVIVLQELWMLDDHDIIRNATEEIYHTTGFYQLSGDRCDGVWSPLGCSGLAILSKYPIISTDFTPFSVAGSYFILDGEILVSKGIGRARIQPTTKMSIDIFTSHTAAFPYNKYYRETQVTELMEAVLTSDAEFIILGGDINYDFRNMSEASYQLITNHMQDSFSKSLDSSGIQTDCHVVTTAESKMEDLQRINEVIDEGKRLLNDIDKDIETLDKITSNDLEDYQDLVSSIVNLEPRETSQTLKNTYRDASYDPEILDYIFYRTRSGSENRVKVLHREVLDLRAQILIEHTSESCLLLFGWAQPCAGCADAVQEKQTILESICKSTKTAQLSLSDHEGVMVNYILSLNQFCKPNHYFAQFLQAKL
ncbi:uncharacterized protein LOC111715244 [Eurytemora carolleeae]|uniref:uncharacterized protein LOC111715244 n=1 Tax=Eurytemora carolleeae TaxID=1294199 RepID=UPI000C75DD0C|nr:uncharacterized protein LOC111715244 [Eurytemora carolleeae]|eukprot:XP_023346320.1 uncharacterized protein LOC111715244 [Eurytemora affinis]